jgi:hypothetical protein
MRRERLGWYQHDPRVDRSSASPSASRSRSLAQPVERGNARESTHFRGARSLSLSPRMRINARVGYARYVRARGRRSCGLGPLCLGAEPAGTAFQVNTYTPNNRSTRRWRVSSTAAFAVIWESALQDEDGSESSANLRRQGPTRTATSSRCRSIPPAIQHQVSVSGLTDGNFAVTWTSDINEETRSTASWRGSSTRTAYSDLDDDIAGETRIRPGPGLRTSGASSQRASSSCGRAPSKTATASASSANASTSMAAAWARVPGEHVHQGRPAHPFRAHGRLRRILRRVDQRSSAERPG